RITAEYQQRIDLAGVHVPDEFLQRLNLIDRVRIERLNVGNRLAGVPERLIHRVRESMDLRRLEVSGNHKTVSFMSLQILRNRGDRGIRRSAGLRSLHACNSESGGERLRNLAHLARLHDEAMIGQAASNARRVLEYVHPVLIRFRNWLALGLHLGWMR